MVGADYIKLIWVPDTFFVNEKEARFHAATQVDLEKNLFSFFIRQFQSVQLSIFIAFQFIDRGENFFFATNTFRCSFTETRPSRNISSGRFWKGENALINSLLPGGRDPSCIFIQFQGTIILLKVNIV